MTQFQIRSPEDIGTLINTRMQAIQKKTQDLINAEVGVFELNLSLSCLGENHLKKAHEDTESFKIQIMDKAKELSNKKNTSKLEEYKKLINFI